MAKLDVFSDEWCKDWEDKVKAMMQGKLKLKGNLPYVVKYLKGVQESIRCLTEVESKFPDD